MPKPFCVVCGKETDEELRSGVCAPCFLATNTLASLPEHVDVEVCVHCHSRKRGEIWLPGFGSMEPIVEEAIREAVAWDKRTEKPRLDVEVTPEDERNFSVKVMARGVAEGLPFEQDLSTRSRIKGATCIRCSRIQGGYYEAIVQIRATKRDLEQSELRAIRVLASRFIERVVEGGDRNAFVLRDLEEHGGLDIYMGTTNAGRMLARLVATEFGGKITDHAKTVGQKDGLDIIRLTFAVRLPEYRAGDYLILGDDVVEVTHIGIKTVGLMDVRNGRTRHVERPSLDRATILPRNEAKEAVIVTRATGELQVLDPWNYQTVSVLIPHGMEVVGDAVEVVKYEGELLVLRPRPASAVNESA